MTRRRLMTRRTVKLTVLSSSPTGDSPAVVFPLKGWPPSSPSFLYRLMRYSSLGTSLETRALWGRTAVARLKFHRHCSEMHEIPLSLVPWMAIITAYTLTKIFTFNSLHVSHLIFMSALNNQLSFQIPCLSPKYENPTVFV